MRVCCRRNEMEDLLGGDLEGVGARNRVAAGQAACLYSLMRPSQRVVRTSRKSSERSVVSVASDFARRDPLGWAPDLGPRDVYPVCWTQFVGVRRRVVVVGGCSTPRRIGDYIDGPARKCGMKGCWHRLAGHVISSPRASKLAGLVKPWAVRRRTWSRLFVPSMRPLEARSVWCQARISSDHAMKVSTVSWYSGSSPVSIEVAEPSEGLQGALVVVGECRGRGAPVGPASRL